MFIGGPFFFDTHTAPLVKEGLPRVKATIAEIIAADRAKAANIGNANVGGASGSGDGQQAPELGAEALPTDGVTTPIADQDEAGCSYAQDYLSEISSGDHNQMQHKTHIGL